MPLINLHLFCVQSLQCLPTLDTVVYVPAPNICSCLLQTGSEFFDLTLYQLIILLIENLWGWAESFNTGVIKPCTTATPSAGWWWRGDKELACSSGRRHPPLHAATICCFPTPLWYPLGSLCPLLNCSRPPGGGGGSWPSLRTPALTILQTGIVWILLSNCP